ncbi:t-SNARE [Mycena vulgaris]|nr:t-SNARE [Mycena vulgaris]
MSLGCGTAICASLLGIVTVRPGRRTAPKPAVQWTVRRRYGRAASLAMIDGTGRWTGRPSTVDGRSVSSTSPNIRPSSRPLVDGTAVLPAARRRDGGLERRSLQGRDGTVSLSPAGLTPAMSFQDLPTLNSLGSSAASPVGAGEQLRSSLSLEIFKIDANVQGIRALAEQIGTPRDSSTIRLRLRDLTEVTRALAQKASKDIKELSAQLPHGPARRKIIADLDVSLHNFQAVQRFSMERQRTNIGAPTHPHIEPAVDQLVDISEPQTPTQTLVYATEDEYRDASLLERQTALREVEQGVAQVAQIFRELAVLVDVQGTDITVVETNAERTAHDLERGAAALETAARGRRRTRRVCLMLILGVVCAVVIVVVIV